MYFNAQIFTLNFADFIELFPFLVLTLSFAVAVLGAGLKLPSRFFKVLGFLGFGLAMISWSLLAFQSESFFMGIRCNSVTRVVGILVSVFGLVSFAGFDVADRYKDRPEWLALSFLAALGLVLLPTSQDWVSFFVFLETFSIPAYILVGYDTKRERSLESSVKYLLAGAFASGLLLMGIALAYLSSGSMSFAGISAQMPENLLSSFSLALILAGLLFKLTAVPFHFWAADVYQGAPMGVAAFLAAATKLSIFTAGALAFRDCGLSLRPDLTTLAVIAAIASALLGSFLAFTQRSFRRMMAYSGTVNAGILAPLMVAGNAGVAPGMFFLFVYGATLMVVMSAFSSIVGKRGLDRNDDLDVDTFSRSDSQSSRMESLFIVMCLISMAGIPPFPGFAAKYWAFSELWNLGHHSLVVAGLLSTLMGVAYYIRISGKFFFTEARKLTEH